VAPRKYRPSAAVSSAGHGQRPPDDPLGSEPTPPPPPAPDRKAETKSDQPAEAISSLKSQIAAQRAYAEQQRAYQQQQTNPIFAYLSQIPGLSAPKLQYLMAYFTAYPDRFNQEHWNTVANAHNIATREHAEDSNEYFRLVNELLHRQHAVPPPPQAAPAPAAPPPMPEPEPQHVHVDLESRDHEPESEPMASYVSAPVSRDGHGRGHTIEPDLSASQVRLTPEERELCRTNKIDETTYAAGKLKLAKMKTSGLIK
jgi:hypothetical protein